MNKYNIRDFLGEKLKDCECTFKSTSYDTENNEYLCQDESAKVYDFDKYIKNNFDNSELPSSPDAIYLGNKKFYFVEFKNSSLHDLNKNKESIQAKFKDGTEILQELLIEFTPKDVKFIFCVVYKKQNTQSQYFDSHPIELNVSKFGLDDINKENRNFYDEIITKDIEYFKEKFKQLKC